MARRRSPSSRSGQESLKLLPLGNQGLQASRGHPVESWRYGVAPSPSRPGHSSSHVAPQAGLAHLPPVGTLRDEPGHQEAEDAPEQAHHHQKHREATVRHGSRWSCQPTAALRSLREVTSNTLSVPWSAAILSLEHSGSGAILITCSPPGARKLNCL